MMPAYITQSVPVSSGGGFLLRGTYGVIGADGVLEGGGGAGVGAVGVCAGGGEGFGAVGCGVVSLVKLLGNHLRLPL